MKINVFTTATIYSSFKEFPVMDLWASVIYVSGGRLNKKDGLTRYGDSHVKDKTS